MWWRHMTSNTKFTAHDDVIKWKHFPCYWPFVRGIHRSPVNSPHKGQWRGALIFFFDLRLNKRLRKQSWGWWFKTLSRPLWRHCNTQSCCKFCHHGHSVHEFITSPKLVWGALEIFDVAWYILQRECRWSRNWDPGRDPKSIFSDKKVITDSCCDIRFYSKTQFNPKSRWISYVRSIYFVCPIILKVCMVRPCSVHNFNDQSTTQEVMRNGVSQHWV